MNNFRWGRKRDTILPSEQYKLSDTLTCESPLSGFML